MARKKRPYRNQQQGQTQKEETVVSPRDVADDEHGRILDGITLDEHIQEEYFPIRFDKIFDKLSKDVEDLGNQEKEELRSRIKKTLGDFTNQEDLISRIKETLGDFTNQMGGFDDSDLPSDNDWTIVEKPKFIDSYLLQHLTYAAKKMAEGVNWERLWKMANNIEMGVQNPSKALVNTVSSQTGLLVKRAFGSLLKGLGLESSADKIGAFLARKNNKRSVLEAEGEVIEAPKEIESTFQPAVDMKNRFECFADGFRAFGVATGSVLVGSLSTAFKYLSGLKTEKRVEKSNENIRSEGGRAPATSQAELSQVARLRKRGQKPQEGPSRG